MIDRHITLDSIRSCFNQFKTFDQVNVFGLRFRGYLASHKNSAILRCRIDRVSGDIVITPFETSKPMFRRETGEYANNDAALIALLVGERLTLASGKDSWRVFTVKLNAYTNAWEAYDGGLVSWAKDRLILIDKFTVDKDQHESTDTRQAT